MMAETLRASGKADTEGERLWYACYTRARHEKRVFARLEHHGVESFLPLIPRLSQWKDRQKWVEWPLFPSYVFVRSSAMDLYDVVTLPGVVSVVRNNGRPVPINEGELANIRGFAKAFQSGGSEIEVERKPYFTAGEWVEVKTGVLAGVRGVVIEHRGERRVMVGLTAIGEGLEVNVSNELLKPVPPP